MESYRLKNIILLILVLLNLFLLGSLSSRHAQETSAREIALTQMTELFAAKGLRLDAALVPKDKAGEVLTLSRDTQQDNALAAFFLGEALTTTDEGGGIVHYASTLGSALFSSGGKFDMELDFTPRSIKEFCQEFSRQFRYGELDFSQLKDGSGTVTALQYFDKRPVVNCAVTLRFQGGALRSVSGQSLPRETASAEARSCIDALTALSAFLEYREESGVPCTAVTEVTLGYEQQSTLAAPLTLMPVWRLRTDVAGLEFYVNCTTREVFAA